MDSNNLVLVNSEYPPAGHELDVVGGENFSRGPGGLTIIQTPAPAPPVDDDGHRYRFARGTQLRCGLIQLFIGLTYLGTGMYYIVGAGFIEPTYHNFWAGGLFLFAGIFALISCCSETTCPIVGCMVLSIFASIVALACAVLMGVAAYAASYVDDNVCIKAVNKVVDTSETLTGLADVMQGAVGGVRISSSLPFIHLLKFLCNYIHGLRVAFCIEAVLGGVELIVAMVQYSVCCRTTCCQGRRPTFQPQQLTTIVY